MSTERAEYTLGVVNLRAAEVILGRGLDNLAADEQARNIQKATDRLRAIETVMGLTSLSMSTRSEPHPCMSHDFRPAPFTESGERVIGRRCFRCGDPENVTCNAQRKFVGPGHLEETGYIDPHRDVGQPGVYGQAEASPPPKVRLCPVCGAHGDQVGEVGSACWTKGCDGVMVFDYYGAKRIQVNGRPKAELKADGEA